ncbi:MAG TPA: hypothetical protein VFN34_08980 [Ornithinibacter sp.]|jgi:hypothetical protein|nr:hypothetical protein [Ornithinibacter sp.]
MPLALASGSLDGPATYVTWGWLGISTTNLVIMLITVAVFVLAVLLPFPHGSEDE